MIIHGDCLEEMRKMADNSISAIVTDPPYGLSFMNKGWDYVVPEMSYWKEALRISKPGAFLVAMGGTRTFHRLTCAIEDAGWEIRDCISWLYGSGFPKSHNHFGIEGYGTALKPAWEPCIVAMKPLDGTFKQNAEKWGQAGINIDGCRIGTDDTQSKCSMTAMGQNSGWNTHENKEVIGGSAKGRWAANVIFDEEAGQFLDQTTCAKVSRFFFIAPNDKIDPCQSQEESLLAGKKTASESNNPNIDMYGKKLMGLFQPDTISIIEMETHSIMSFPILSVSRHKLIGICTLECEKIIQKSQASNIESVSIAESGVCYLHFQNAVMEPIKAIVKNVPANAWLNGESSIGNIGTNIIGKEDVLQATNTTKNISTRIEIKSTLKDESDTQSRLFYCAKASSRERNEGLEGLEKNITGSFEGNVDELGSRKIGRSPDTPNIKSANNHPTVKPLKLMEYLIKLVMPPKDGILLDPFAGSGTTILAAKRLGFNAIGIEKQAEYCEIARARIDNFTSEKIAQEIQQLFDFEEDEAINGQ